MQRKNPRADPNLIDAWITVLKNLPEVHLRAILAHFSKEEKPPSLIGLGRAGSSMLSRAQLIDYCKRIEFCYKEWPGHLGKSPFMPFSQTEQLALEIAEKHGKELLKTYVEHLEKCLQNGLWGGFSRPERMPQHFQAWKENPPSPTQ